MVLNSHPVPNAQAGSDDAVEEYKDSRDVHIRVSQSPGFLCHIHASARVNLSPRTLWESCIVHPDNAAIFRHMDICSFRKIHSDDGDGRRRVEVLHESGWRFLMLKGKFVTRLMVEEDHENRVMRFELLPYPHERSILSKFHGEWRIDPHPEDPDSCVSLLDQDLKLHVWLPPPFDRLLKSISCGQVRNIFEDLRREAVRINSGRPTLAPYSAVKDKEIGAREASCLRVSV